MVAKSVRDDIDGVVLPYVVMTLAVVIATACAVQLATEIMVDLYTFFSPPAPYHQLYVLRALEAAPTHETSLEGAGKVCASQNSPDKGVTHAVNRYRPD